MLVIVPEGRGAVPVYGNKGIADGPQVRLTESRALPQVIHPSLLENPYDKARLKYYTTGQRKPAALYMYPYEDHRDATYQSDLDIWARWLAWFDIYVKNGQKPKTTALVP